MFYFIFLITFIMKIKSNNIKHKKKNVKLHNSTKQNNVILSYILRCKKIQLTIFNNFTYKRYCRLVSCKHKVC